MNRTTTRPTIRTAILALVAGLACSAGALAQTAQTSEFTYQGRLDNGSTPATGNFDLEFALFNAAAGGSQVGPTVSKLNTAVNNGLFTTVLDFGNVFNSTQLWLEIRVRVAGGGAYTTLTPRTKATGAPSSLSVRLPASSSTTMAGSPFNITNNSALTTGGGISASVGTAAFFDLSGYFTPAILAQSSAGNGLFGTTTRSGAWALAGLASGSAARAVMGFHEGTGQAGYFQIANNANNSDALTATTNGGGSAARMTTTDTANTNNTFEVVQSGTGRAGFFDNNNSGATVPTLEAESSAPSGSQSDDTAGIAIKGSSNGGFSKGVYGYGLTAGVWGVSGASGGFGVWGQNNTTGGEGVRGSTSANGAAGVAGYGNFGTGVYGQTSSGYGIFGSNGGSNVTGYAGYFNGRVHVNGTLSKNSGAFRIDHPLDPANMYLQHSFVESPDMKNIYDGVVVLNDKGEAVVEMPKWFDALNADFRYQLTCVGGYAPVYIAEEITERTFKIAGGKPGLKISWQVTGTRIDAFAKDNRIQIEIPKTGAEQGRYLYPAGFGAGLDKQINTPADTMPHKAN